MARTVTYQLFSNQTASLAGAATVQVVQPGRIVGVTMGIHGVSGATAGTYIDQLCLNSPNTLFNTANNPPREVILATTAAAGAVSTVLNTVSPSIPQSISIRPGDILSLNVALTGTAGVGVAHWANVCVQENGG